MSDYEVDRARLEAHSTEEILKVLREERDDYTPEAIRIFEEIIKDRGLKSGGPPRAAVPAASDGNSTPSATAGDTMIRNPNDAVHVLNDLLSGVLNGTVDPQAAAVASNIVMAILRAMEQEYMTYTEESP